MSSFTPGDIQSAVAEAIESQMVETVEAVRTTADAYIVFPGARSTPVNSTRNGPVSWRVELGGGIGVIEEFGGTYSAPKAPLRRACEANGLTLS